MTQYNNNKSNLFFKTIIKFFSTNKLHLIQLFVFILFVVFCIGLVISNGVCCGDDAYHAIIAKNLSNGLGYTSTVLDSSTDFRETIFDPRSGVGPTIILPTSLIIKLFGNTHWAPGISLVILWGVLLISIRFSLSKIIKNQLFITIGLVFFISFSYLFFAYHFEQWYALFGEIPAALLIILAILIFYQNESRINSYLAGLLFAFSMQSKPLAIIPFVAFLSYLVIIYFVNIDRRENGSAKILISRLVLVFLGFFTPIIIFELWKCLKLGFSEYQVYLKNYIFWAKDKGVGGTSFSWNKLINRIKIINQRFGMFLPVVLLILSGNLFFLREDKKLSQIYNSFFTIVIGYTFYWILFSIGWARYFVICLVIILFMLILPLFSIQKHDKRKIVYAVLLILLSIYNISTIDVTYPLKNQELFVPSEYTKSIDNMSSILSSQLENTPFITQWWATAADLEYSMSTHLNFTTFRDTAFSFNKPYILVANSKFILQEDQDFAELVLTQCKTRIEGQFIYGICDPTNNQ